MKNRIFLAILLACALMACSNSTPKYVGNTYEGSIGYGTLTYQFLDLNEFRIDINSSWAGHFSCVCHYYNNADNYKELFPELYEPLLTYLDGCVMLSVDSMYDPSNSSKKLSVAEFVNNSGYKDLGDVMSYLLYNNETDEIITLSFKEYVTFIGNKCFDQAYKSKEQTGQATINTTCRSELPRINGFVCSRKKQ